MIFAVHVQVMTLNVSGEEYDLTGKDAPQITMAIQSAVMGGANTSLYGLFPYNPYFRNHA